jgi:hypothetical protein
MDRDIEVAQRMDCATSEHREGHEVDDDEEIEAEMPAYSMEGHGAQQTDLQIGP